MKEVDSRIATVDGMLAANAAQIRIWRRSTAVVTSFPRELAERLSRMEQAVEATAEEVERIGEGQRFLTRLFTEGEGARAIGAGAAQPLERKPVKSPERLP